MSDRVIQSSKFLGASHPIVSKSPSPHRDPQDLCHVPFRPPLSFRHHLLLISLLSHSCGYEGLFLSDICQAFSLTCFHFFLKCSFLRPFLFKIASFLLCVTFLTKISSLLYSLNTLNFIAIMWSTTYTWEKWDWEAQSNDSSPEAGISAQQLWLQVQPLSFVTSG